jgi:hypothetical protein
VAARHRRAEPDEEPAVGVDSSGVYEDLPPEALGYGELPRVEDEEPDPDGD